MTESESRRLRSVSVHHANEFVRGKSIKIIKVVLCGGQILARFNEFRFRPAEDVRRDEYLNIYVICFLSLLPNFSALVELFLAGSAHLLLLTAKGGENAALNPPL